MATIDLLTGTSYVPRREDYITQISVCRMAPAGTPHPVWDAFLLRVTANDIDLVKFLQRFVGYCMTGHTIEHVFLFIYGTGRNGKGTFINTIMKIFGDYAAVASIATFLASKGDRHPTEIAKLRGKRLVVAQETPAGRVWDEAKIKALTGGDRMSAHFMRQDDFEFDPVFKLIISGNHKPRLNCVDVAMRARLLMVPFTVEIPAAERDLNLMDRLRAEWPAILRWAMDGCSEWRRIGLAPPASVTKATEEYFTNEDTFTQWLEDKCRVEHNNTYLHEPVGDLYTSWQSYCKENGDEPGSKKSFSEEMRSHSFTPFKFGHGKVRSFSGIQLKRDTSDNQESDVETRF
jgi:putative DNA primase/helicase